MEVIWLTITMISVRAEEDIDHEIRIEESVNSRAPLVSDMASIAWSEFEDCDIYLRLEYCG